MKVPTSFPDRSVCIVGLGYVGLTLAVAMAEVGFEVYGVERDAKVVEAVGAGRAHFVEAGLAPRLAAQVAAGRIKASLDWPEKGRARVYIITVGTPLADGQVTNLDAIRLVSAKVAALLREGDFVILRSTVRVGVSREVVKPLLDEAGVAYSLAFCPERTLEGKALIELRTLPQIVGGLDEESAIRASQMFNFVTPTTIRVPDLETAEMIKLINNTQRDLMFAFANEVADMCDAIGVSAVEVIRAGNMGYSRASMPMPGPVGGPCLEKDPYILADGVQARGGQARLALLGRGINEEMPEQTVARIAAALDGAAIAKIAIAGLAFKGRPETSDLRGTLAIPLIVGLKRKYPSARIVGYDPAVARDDVLGLGITCAETAAEAFEGADCVVFQNNNASFELLDLAALAAGMRPGAVIYDLWNQFEVETLNLGGRVKYFGFGSRVLLNGRSRAV
jgi:nucleotide sugar dehydrogenase